MSTPRFAFHPILGHEIHVTEWGRTGAPALVMMHGLARTGRDFDELARALSNSYHVLCPDMIGRGLSGWSAQPSTDYRIGHYAEITLALLDGYKISQAAWIGTSMGGQIGMRIACGEHHRRLTGLLVNDIGPEVPEEALERILSYVGKPPEFATVSEAQTWFRTAYAPFGPASDLFWQRMVATSLRRRSNGAFTLHYDPALTHQFTDAPEDMECWDGWAKITVPTDLFFGGQSDLVTPDILERMTRTRRDCKPTCFKECGHAPTLSRPSDIALVRQALARYL